MVHWDEARLGRWFCIAGAAIGALGLAGWLTKATFLDRILPGEPLMMPNTGLALLLLGSAGGLRHRRDAGRARTALSLVLALVVLAIGAGTLVEYVLGIDLGIDQLFLRAPGGPYPGRPSPLTAIALTLLSAALCIFDYRATRRARPSEWLALLAALVSSVGFIGLIFGAGAIYRLPKAPVVGVALPTGVALLLISVGLLLERPSAGVMAVATSRGPGGVMLRRLLPPSILAPVLLGLLVMHASIAWGVDEPPLLVAAHASAMIIVALILMTGIAAPLNRTHAALEANRAHLQSLIEQAPDGIFVADLDGRYTEVNEAGCRMLGRGREDIVGKSIVDLIPAEDVPRLEQSKAQMLEGKSHVAEWKLRHADGRFIPVEVSARILPDGRWQGFVRDITQRMRVESAQRLFADVGALLGGTLQSEEMIPNVAKLVVRDLADVCIIDVVEDNVASRRISATAREPSDRARCGSLRIDRKELRLVRKLSPEDLEALAPDEACLRALQERKIQSLIVVPLAAGRSSGVLALLSASRPYGDEDLGIARGLAERLGLAIENARLYAAAQRAIRMRDEVLGIVAHDLRNPVGIILMQADALRNQPRAPEVIKRAARRMDRLIGDLLDVTRMEAGRLTIERARLPAALVVAEAVDAQRPLASSTAIDLRVEVPKDLPDVSADRHRLLQIFENLIGNAFKFSERGGAVTVGATPRGDDVLFWVKDTGAGIRLEDQPRVFDRFWQAQHRAARHGAGLGLPIVKGLVEAHGGRIWLESTPGRGSTFFFTIPSAPRETAHYELARHA